MDANKRVRLILVGYQIQPTCGTCAHFTTFSADLFGTCKLHAYEHEKHSEAVRDLSVCRYGTCEDHERSAEIEVRLHGFTEFIS